MKHYSTEECQKLIDTAKALLGTNRTLQDIYEMATTIHGLETACVYFDDDDKKKSYNYEEYKTRTFYLAQRLSSTLSAIPVGSIVALKIKNCPAWAHIFWAILMTGHVPLLINSTLAHENTQNLITQSRAKAIIVNEGEPYSVPTFRLIDITNNDIDYNFNPIWANNVIFCSSGTTGNIKMMVYDGESLCYQINSSLAMPKESTTIMHPGEINILAMIPFHHIFGFVAVFLWYTFYGKAIVYPKSTNSKDIINACKNGHVTHLYSVPLFWDGIAQAINRKAAAAGDRKQQVMRRMMDFNTEKISGKEAGSASWPIVVSKVQKEVLGNRIEYCISGGGYLSMRTLTTINGLGYPLYNGFGMTELGVTSVELSPKVGDRLRCSIGHPLDYVEYKIGPSIDGKPNQGELLVKAKSMHNKQLINGQIKDPDVDENGYYHTGDIAEKDSTGMYYIKGRMKDVIINSNGENVYPDELEFYFKNIHHVLQCVVVGVKKPDTSNEIITLVLELDNSIDKRNLKKVEKDCNSVNDTLPNEKRIDQILIYKKQMPLANGLKVKRYIIKDALDKGEMDNFVDFDGKSLTTTAPKKKEAIDFSRWNEKEVKKTFAKVKDVWSKILIIPTYKIEDTSEFEQDLGGDSMSYVTMVQEINKEFRITFPIELYGKLTRVDEFVEEILLLKHPLNNKNKEE